MSNQPTALITGSAHRIGAAIVDTLHQEGYRVIIHYHESRQAAQALCDRCNQQQPDSAAIQQADLTDLNEAAELIPRAIAVWGELHLLVNNASRYYPTPIGTANPKQWQELINTNLSAPFFLAQAAFPHLQKNKGCIINISDACAEKASHDYNIYRTAKSALNALTRSLAAAMAPQVRVNAIAPGKTLWPATQHKLSENEKAAALARVPLQRQADLNEITDALLFLLANQYITGQVIKVDGGLAL